MYLASNKASIICSGILLMLLLLNNSHRLNTQVSSKDSTIALLDKGELILPQKNIQAYRTFERRYTKYFLANGSEKSNDDNQKSKAQLAKENTEKEAAQAGRLQTVLVDDNILSLKAVIKNEAMKTVALIAITNKNNNETTVKKYNVNNNLLGFNIEKIKKTEVIIKRIFNEKIQQLTLVMYK